MTPEQQQQFDYLRKEVERLTKLFDLISATSTIPKSIDDAFRARLGIRDLQKIPSLSLSAVSASAHNKAVNEAGASSYQVLNNPNGFLQVIIGGITYVIPYY